MLTVFATVMFNASFRRILRDNALKSIQVLIEQTLPSDKYGKFPKKMIVRALGLPRASNGELAEEAAKSNLCGVSCRVRPSKYLNLMN